MTWRKRSDNRYVILLIMERMAQGLSQRQLAPKIPVSRSHLTDMENGNNDVGVDMLARWAKALGLRTVITFERESNEESNSPVETCDNSDVIDSNPTAN